LRLVPEGSGLAVEQSVKPGTRVKAGTAVRVKFAPPGQGTEGGQTSGGTDRAGSQQNELLNPYAH